MESLRDPFKYLNPSLKIFREGDSDIKVNPKGFNLMSSRSSGQPDVVP
jgi:hypothetical protein